MSGRWVGGGELASSFDVQDSCVEVHGGLYRSPRIGAWVGDVHFMLLVSISFTLGTQGEPSFKWNMGLKQRFYKHATSVRGSAIGSTKVDWELCFAHPNVTLHPHWSHYRFGGWGRDLQCRNFW